MYKLVAIDMDGTLLRDDKTISQENYKAIQKAKAMGVKVVLATGRPIDGIKRYLDELNLISNEDYAIAFGGALVQNTKTGEILSEHLMTLGDLSYLYDLSKKLNVNIHALTPDSVITPRESEYTLLESNMNKVPLKIVDFDTIDSSTKIAKIMLVDEASKLQAAIKKLPQDVYDKYTVVQSAPFFLEFLNKTVNKGFGVEVLSSKLNLSSSETICIGDAGNDIDMIKYAGLGVAMGNAFPEVKKIADYITLSNEEDGVAHVINKFIVNS